MWLKMKDTEFQTLSLHIMTLTLWWKTIGQSELGNDLQNLGSYPILVECGRTQSPQNNFSTQHSTFLLSSFRFFLCSIYQRLSTESLFHHNIT